MTITANLGTLAQTPSVRIAPDRRRNRRFQITLLGRFMRANKREYPCKLQDLSVGGAAISSPIEVEPGERIVAYFDHIGGVEGTVVRAIEGGFALQFTATQHKKEKLAAQITWLINRHELDPTDMRRPGHERTELTNNTSVMRLPDGLATSVRIIDLSISGASIGTEARPVVGAEIAIGKLRAKVVRHHADGIGIQFIDIQNPEALRKYFG
jgi:hypothetical protein